MLGYDLVMVADDLGVMEDIVILNQGDNNF